MHRTPVIQFFVSPVFCVARFKHSYHSIYVLSCIFPFEMMKMLSLMQTTHVSDGWINSRQLQWFWSRREWQSTPTSSTRGYRRSSCRANWNFVAVGTSSIAAAGWASCSSSARGDLPGLSQYAAPTIHQSGGATWRGRLDSHHWVQVFFADYSLFRSEQDLLCRAATWQISLYVVGSLPRNATGWSCSELGWVQDCLSSSSYSSGTSWS